MKKLNYLSTICLSLLFLCGKIGFGQGIGINNNSASANLSAMFDITSGTGANRGLLIPRVTNAQLLANFNPLPQAAQGLIIYQTDGVQGFYYNTSTTTTPTWVLLGAGSGWNLTGNTGTIASTTSNPMNNNFIGTTDAKDFVIATSNTERMRILSGGNVGIGTATPTTKLHINAGDLGIGRIDGGDATPYVHLGLSNGYEQYLANNAYYQVSPAQWNFVNTGGYGGLASMLYQVSGTMQFFTASNGANPVAWSQRMTILNNGNIGINNAGPGAKLDVTGPATGTGMTIFADGGGDVVLASGGSLFFDGNYSYATGNYIRPIGGANTQGFFTSGAERMRIISTGQVGIGTIPTMHLDVADGSTTDGYSTIRGAATGNARTFGVNGTSSSTTNFSAGVRGDATGASGYDYGVYGLSTHYGVTGLGNGIASPNYLIAGGGGAFEGTNYGMFSLNTSVVNNSASGVFWNGSGPSIYSYVAYISGSGTGYGILSNYAKSTVVTDQNEQERIMFCPEAPEVLFEDYGEGKLTNGKIHITLDSILSYNINVDEKHPLRVFIQLKGDCNGVYITNETNTGFDVVELNHGASSVAFFYHVIGNRTNAHLKPGAPKHCEIRFPTGEKRPETYR